MGSLGEAVLRPRVVDGGVYGETEFYVYSSLSQPTERCEAKMVSETGFEDDFSFSFPDFKPFSGGPEGYYWRLRFPLDFYHEGSIAGVIPDLTLEVSTWERVVIGYVTIKVELPPPAYIIQPPVVTVSTYNADSPPPA